MKSDGGEEEYVYSSFFQLFLSPLRSSMCRLFVVALLGWFTNTTAKSQTNKQNAGGLRQLLFLFRVLELGDGITRSNYLPIVFIVLIAPIVGFYINTISNKQIKKPWFRHKIRLHFFPSPRDWTCFSLNKNDVIEFLNLSSIYSLLI